MSQTAEKMFSLFPQKKKRLNGWQVKENNIDFAKKGGMSKLCSCKDRMSFA